MPHVHFCISKRFCLDVCVILFVYVAGWKETPLWTAPWASVRLGSWWNSWRLKPVFVESRWGLKMWQARIRSVVILHAYKCALLYQPVRNRLICIRCDQRSGIRLIGMTYFYNPPGKVCPTSTIWSIQQSLSIDLNLAFHSYNVLFYLKCCFIWETKVKCTY